MCNGRPCAEKGKDLSWPEVMKHFFADIARWVAQGAPLASEAEHSRRFRICQGCPQYVRYRCQQCGCVAIAKAKLGTSRCELNRW